MLTLQKSQQRCLEFDLSKAQPDITATIQRTTRSPPSAWRQARVAERVAQHLASRPPGDLVEHFDAAARVAPPRGRSEAPQLLTQNASKYNGQRIVDSYLRPRHFH